MSYVIKPLPLTRSYYWKASMTYGLNYPENEWLVQTTWYIKAGGKNVIVDTGVPFDYLSSFPSPKPPEEMNTFEAALGSVGLTPQDIDVVIQTHLHFDHCANTEKCHNANVIVQEEELKFSRNPHPIQAMHYRQELIDNIDFEVVNGEREILPGISVIPVPGHTPGCQAVSVETDSGPAIICGFCSVKDNLYPPEPIVNFMPVIAPGVHIHAAQAFDSALKVKQLAAIAVPLHSMEFSTMECIP